MMTARVMGQREYGVWQWTEYRWRSKFGGMNISGVKRLKALEKENIRLKRIVAQQAISNNLLKELITIVIAAYNVSGFVEVSLYGLAKLTKNKYRVIICDNG